MKPINSKHLLMLIVYLLTFIEIRSKIITSLVEFIRHGARSSNYFQNFSSTLLYGAEKNQITHLGLMQHYLLGRLLKQRYFDFFMRAKIYELRSSPKQRCIQSAYSNINGIYPEKEIVFRNENQDLNLKEAFYPPGYSIDKLYPLNDKIEITINDPLKNYYFFPENCLYNERKISSLLPYITIFKIDIQEITFFANKIINKLRENYRFFINDNEWESFINSLKHPIDEREISKIISFYEAIKEHSSRERKEKLKFSEEDELLLKKLNINKFYGNKISIGEEYSEGLKLANSGIFRSIVNQFNLSSKNQSYFGLLSGHDLNIITMFSLLFDNSKLLHSLRSSSLSDEEIAFFIPPLASSLLFILEESSLNIKYVRIVLNNKDISNHELIHSDLHPDANGILLQRFIEHIRKRTINLSEDEICSFMCDIRENSIKSKL